MSTPDPPHLSTSRLRRLASRARTLAVAYTIVLFVATHVPGLPSRTFSLEDKIEHLVAYSVLTFCVLACWELTIGVLQPKHYFAVWLAGTMYGAIDEATQIPVGRTCDINDWVADVLGIVCGIILFQLLRMPMYRFFVGRDAMSLGK